MKRGGLEAVPLLSGIYLTLRYILCLWVLNETNSRDMTPTIAFFGIYARVIFLKLLLSFGKIRTKFVESYLTIV